MKAIDLPPGNSGITIKIPEPSRPEVVRPALVRPAPDPERLIQAALDQPVGMPLLETQVSSGRTVAVIIDDISRITPTRLMLPPVLERLKSAGIRRKDIRIVIALGTHRTMTEEEILSKTGAQIAREYEIINTPCWDNDRMVFLGTSKNGIPAWVNRTVAEADIRIGIGAITPHMDTGYSGGAKIILPGVCGCETVDRFHIGALQVDSNQLGCVDTPLRVNLEAFVEERIGLDFILNAVFTSDGFLYKCVAGHFREAHRIGVTYADEVYGVPVTKRYPMVISNAFPNDLDLWQSTKAIWSGEMMTEDRGLLVLVTRSPDGNQTHPLFSEYAGRDPEKLREDLEKGAVEDPAACVLAVLLGRMRRRIRLALVSSGLDPAVARQMGCGYFETVEEAVSEELSRGNTTNAAVGVLTHGGVTLPLLDKGFMPG